jgi:hypothetical protein
VVTLDVRAVVLGALVAAAAVVPVATVGALVADDGSAAAVPFGVAALAGFLAGGFVAGSRQPSAALRHGAIAAAAAVAAALLAAAVLRLARDEDLRPGTMAVVALLATCLGVAGGWLADRRR